MQHSSTAIVSDLSSEPVGRAPDERSRGIVGWLAGKYNRFRRTLFPPRLVPTSFRELNEIRQLALIPSDIDEHLERMFIEATLCRPKLIVELGVRGGTSTFVLTRAAQISGADLISVDIAECSKSSSYARWRFVQADDIEFAREFPSYCDREGIAGCIDLLFIDTSHYYEHTLQEIKSWSPLLSPAVKVMFHDTNLKTIGRRRDGCYQLAWNNKRGVTRAIERQFGVRVREDEEYTDYVHPWILRHWPNCNGLTILDRVAAHR